MQLSADPFSESLQRLLRHLLPQRSHAVDIDAEHAAGRCDREALAAHTYEYKCDRPASPILVHLCSYVCRCDREALVAHLREETGAAGLPAFYLRGEYVGDCRRRQW